MDLSGLAVDAGVFQDILVNEIVVVVVLHKSKHLAMDRYPHGGI